jgi:hypothetical protein
VQEAGQTPFLYVLSRRSSSAEIVESFKALASLAAPFRDPSGDAPPSAVLSALLESDEVRSCTAPPQLATHYQAPRVLRVVVQRGCNALHYMVQHNEFLPFMDELLRSPAPFGKRFVELLETKNHAGVRHTVIACS